MTANFGRLTVRADGMSGKKATEYEATVVGMLRSFEQWEAGKALMRAFAFYNRPVLVFPYDGALGKCNARANGDLGGMFPNQVSISPQMFNGSSSCFPATAASATPHEILFHELVHAARAVAGKLGTYSPWGEEVAAIMVANVLSSEMNRPIRSPWSPTSIAPVQMDPAVFMRLSTDILSMLYHQMPEFFRWIAEVNVAFNPVRLYYLTVLRGVPRLNSAP